LGQWARPVVIDVAEGAGIGSWDLRASRLALASVLRRRPEPYHAQIIEAALHKPVEALAGGSGPEATDVHSQELSKLIVYDDHERRSGLVRIVDTAGDAVGGFDTAAWEGGAGYRLTARHHSTRRRLELCARPSRSTATGSPVPFAVSVEVTPESAFAGTLELEWNINLLGGGGNRGCLLPVSGSGMASRLVRVRGGRRRPVVRQFV